ncbi:cytochrome b5 domain-containing protein [Nesterenkonia alkaliphila]|nr:cytochrome b5-like heme/steroid binding domain-containing protein [Nesterenkonia alkaliphila]GFZ97327.1 hypothetical protein GCM10011359_28350 [Nesterenkonia alkaliphila]
MTRIPLIPLAAACALLLTSCSGEAEPLEIPAGESSGEQFTLAEVAEHDDAGSCWAAVEGRVYDLTDWIDEHPGGPTRITQLCGTDATQQFANQHRGQERPTEQLSEFEIGILQD